MLWLLAALLGLAVAAIVLGRWRAGTPLVYGACLLLSAAGLAAALRFLLAHPEATAQLTLPLGIPWLGAHFRLDPLSAFFLAVVNLGAAAASGYAITSAQEESDMNSQDSKKVNASSASTSAQEESDMNSQASKKVNASAATTTRFMPARNSG